MRDCCGPQSASCVSCGRLDEDAPIRAFPRNPSDRYAVQGHSTSQAEILARHALVQITHLVQENLFKDDLNTPGYVRAELIGIRSKRARQVPEQAAEIRRVHHASLH